MNNAINPIICRGAAACALPLLLQAPHTALADALPIDPGLWQTTYKVQSPFGVKEDTESECITENEFDPRKHLAETDGCEVTETRLSGKTLTFKMSCSMEGGQGTMEGRYTSNGSSGDGTMTMKVQFNGQSMQFDSSFNAKRIGSC